MVIEQWKRIENFTDYMVSNQGRVKRATPGPGTVAGKILTPTPDRYGYLKVFLRNNGKTFTKRVHILVAQTFIPNPLSLPEVNHIGFKSDCRASMLEWRSKAGNNQHAMKTGRETGDGVTWDRRKNKWMLRLQKVFKGYFETKKEALERRTILVQELPHIV
jgi:hypothetical protein